jgi:hypothetical protein
MPEVISTHECKVKDTCDQLIAWGFCCDKPAAYLVKEMRLPLYAIMCVSHAGNFRRMFPNADVGYHAWSLELNQKFADEAKEYWNESTISNPRK